MGLEEILKELGANEPFIQKENGKDELSVEGAKALDKLIKIVDGLEYIGALGKTGDELECYCDEIIRLGY